MDYIVDYQLNWSTRRIDYLDSTPKVSELNSKTIFICVLWFLNLGSRLHSILVCQICCQDMKNLNQHYTSHKLVFTLWNTLHM